jgi:two-component system response regulator AtoC
MAEKDKILVVDDEPGVRQLLKALLEQKGYRPTCVERAEDAMEILGREHFSLILTDLRLPGMKGEELVGWLKRQRIRTPVIVISAYGDQSKIIEVIKRGADDFLPKPFKPEDLEIVVLKSLAKNRLLAQNEQLRKEISGGALGGMVGHSKAMENVFQILKKLAASTYTVLLTGESGVGKELAARALHELSPRAGEPFVQINAGSLPVSLFEAELFGVVKGAYTDATQSRDGLFQAAQGGTLFLDEIAEVPLEVQAKLLRVLESGEVKVLGESRSKKVDVRVVAATNRDLSAMVETGEFRKDLYYRLSVLPVSIPPLRERRDDIPLLADHFLRRQEGFAKDEKRLSAAALKVLVSHSWPGNVRELKNTLERAVLLAEGGEIDAQDLFLPLRPNGFTVAGNFREAKRVHLQAFEKQYLSQLLSRTSGNVSKAALEAGLARRNFQNLLKKYHLKPSAFKKA